MECLDIRRGGRLVEPRVEEHLHEVVVRGDAYALDPVAVRRDRLAVDVPEAGATLLFGIAGEGPRRGAAGVRDAGVRADGLRVRRRGGREARPLSRSTSNPN
jgi:hypothetical protein